MGRVGGRRCPPSRHSRASGQPRPLLAVGGRPEHPGRIGPNARGHARRCVDRAGRRRRAQRTAEPVEVLSAARRSEQRVSTSSRATAPRRGRELSRASSGRTTPSPADRTRAQRSSRGLVSRLGLPKGPGRRLPSPDRRQCRVALGRGSRWALRRQRCGPRPAGPGTWRSGASPGPPGAPRPPPPRPRHRGRAAGPPGPTPPRPEPSRWAEDHRQRHPEDRRHDLLRQEQGAPGRRVRCGPPSSSRIPAYRQCRGSGGAAPGSKVPARGAVGQTAEQSLHNRRRGSASSRRLLMR